MLRFVEAFLFKIKSMFQMIPMLTMKMMVFHMRMRMYTKMLK